ncbi:wall-associated receptor kinase-like 14 [Carex littledalei]|uniref:Wall-associated receptor kinase-like 14 n=1 Tax=Carex littledalei TaxID=544730 RepID=A0A833VBY5_9POAL|nr:wall-associated receptor kinase-like 14 [Carex littledalei]
MLQIILFLSLIAASVASCNRTCDKTTVPYPFGFSPSCSIPLSCNSTSGISFSGFPLQNFTANNTFLLNISANCTRPVTSASAFFSTNYALTHRNGLFLRDCAPSATTPCLLPTMVVSQMLSACGLREDNLTCFFNNTGNMYLTEDGVFNRSLCGDLFTSILYEPDVAAGQTVLALGIVEIGWWMTGNCHCAANASCTRIGSDVKDGYWCKCDEGFIGDGFADGDGCRRGTLPMKVGSRWLPTVAGVSAACIMAVIAVIGIWLWGWKTNGSTSTTHEEASTCSLEDAHAYSRVWEHVEGGEIDQLKDPVLEDVCTEEVTKCIQIGLLCVQEDPIKRPNMEAVNVLLSGYSTTIPALPPLQLPVSMVSIISGSQESNS